MSSFEITHDFFIKASPDEIFNAVSDPKELENWWPKECTGRAELNASYNFVFSEPYNWWGIVAQCEPGKSFYVKMTDADDDWNPTTFGFEFEALENTTKVRFTHRDWPRKNDHFRIASFCWAILLNGLKNYLEKGIVVPFEERE